MALQLVNLKAEAAREAARLAKARALLRDNDESALMRLESGAVWMTTARRRVLKQRLSGRACLIWRVAFEDPSGRLVESTLVPVLVDVGRTRVTWKTDRERRVWLRALFDRADAFIRAEIETASASWRADVERLSSAYSGAQRDRAAEIEPPTDAGDGIRQSGLFDRRAERSREAIVAAVAESARVAALRRHAIAAAADIVPTPARLLLVVAP